HTRSDRDWSSDVCSSDLGVGATIASPASALRAPTAELAQPFAASIVDVDDVQYVYVVYNDPNRAGLNDASILDAAGEFTVSVRRSEERRVGKEWRSRGAA